MVSSGVMCRSTGAEGGTRNLGARLQPHPLLHGLGREDASREARQQAARGGRLLTIQNRLGQDVPHPIGPERTISAVPTAGGAAYKLGNRYETLWAIDQLLRI